MSAESLHLRRAGPTDLPFLARMGWYAANWRPDADPPPAEDVLTAEGRLGVYLAGWGRAGDAGVVAHADGERPVGAAWYRLFRQDGPGYGFVSESVPELSIAVRPESRRGGVGTALLAELLRVAAEEGHVAVSLSVEPDNPARRLYERAGFRKVGTVGDAWTMLVELA